MQIRYKMHPIFILFLCLLFILPVVFAQNNDALKPEIYSKLRDRRCNEPLDKCDCPDAKEMKGYIDAFLEIGMDKDEIFYKVAKKFSLNTILDASTKTAVEKRLAEEAGDKRPQINFNSTAFNFGQVSKKQGKISKVFRLSNKGNSPLIIKNLKTSCPCASVSLKVNPVRNTKALRGKSKISNGVNKTKSPYFGIEGSPKEWQSEIKPQESGELELMVDLASPYVKTGRLIRDASLTSNDPVYPEVTVRTEAEVEE